MDVRDRFEREVDIVRGAGGFAPTTDDLRWLGEALAYEAMGSTMPQSDEAEIREMRRQDALDHLAYGLAHRHEDAEARQYVRIAVEALRELNKEVAT